MKKIIALLLLVSMFSFCLVACESGDENNSNENGSANESANAENSGEVVIKTEVQNMNGREFNVLCHDFTAGLQLLFGYSGEIMYAEENPSSVDEAKKRVVDYIESTYNCTINGELTSAVYGKSVAEIVKNQVQSGLHHYDIVFDTLGNAPTLALEDMIVDLNSVPNINLSDPWWDQNAVKDLSIGGKVYFVNGDINTYDDQGTWCVLFNKTLKTKLGVEEDLYQLVRDNQWTYDKFIEICKRDLTYDSTGDGVLDEFDTWAFGTESYNVYIQLVGAGLKIAEKNSDDLPYLTVADIPQQTYNLLADVLDFYALEDTVMVANTPKYQNKNYHNVFEATVHKSFIEGRELFYMCGLMNCPSFRQMEDEFGILPIPKYYETQDRYYHTISSYNSTVLMIPEGTVDIGEVGLIVSAIAEQSKYIVTPAYYDVQLKYRDSRDDESGEMLDLIFASRTFDLGCYYNWGGIRDQYTSLSGNNIASRFDATLSVAQIEMESFIESVQAKK